MSVYNVGDELHLEVTFADLENTPTDPTTVLFAVKTPTGTTTEYIYGTDEEVSNPETGVYALDVMVTEAGEWGWKCTGTGAVNAADQGIVRVRRSVA